MSVRKAINFDLDTKALKEFYPGKDYRAAYGEIKAFMEILTLTMKSKLYKQIKNLKRLDDASATNGSDNEDIESNERLKEFKQLFSGFAVKEIPKKEDLDYIRIKRYVK